MKAGSSRGCWRRSACDLDQVHFDIPRMRTLTSNNYLTTGIAYAFHPHLVTPGIRAPTTRSTRRLPIFDIEPGNAMAFHPNYFSRWVTNDSDT